MLESTTEVVENLRPFESNKRVALDEEDITKFRSISSSWLGENKTPYDIWNDKSKHASHLRKLSGPAEITNHMISDELIDRYGPENDLSKAATIVSFITPEITSIAAKQLEAYKGPRSWYQVEPIAAGKLFGKIDAVLTDPVYSAFLSDNPSFKDALAYIKDTLIQTADPDKIYSEYSKYIQKCIKDNSEGKVTLYVPLDSDYTHATTSDDEKTMICEAALSLLAPLTPEKKDYFNKINQYALEYLPHRRFARNNKRFNFLVGDTVIGAGMEVFSTTSGETFTFKNSEENEHGFYLAINSLDKKKNFWMTNGQLLTMSWPELNEDMTPYFETLYLSHEKSHRFWPYHGIYGEFPADVPSVIFSLTYSEKLGLNLKQMIRAIATEYFSEVLEYVKGGRLIDQKKQDKMSQLNRGYLVSAVEITNAIAKSQLMTVVNGKISINNDGKTIDKFKDELERVNSRFHKAEPKVKAKLKYPVLSPFVKPILELYQKTIEQ